MINYSEKYIEKKVCEYAKSKGWLVYKFSSPSLRSVPDRIFIKSSKVFFVEFKAPGKKASKAQLNEIEKIELEGIPVFIVDNVERGKEITNVYS